MTETMAFGWYRAVTAVSEPGVVIGWPPTDVITSPGTMPAEAAAVSHRTPRTSAPAAIGATRAGMPDCWLVVWQDESLPPRRPPPACASSAACCCGLELLLVATSTPRKPGRPTYTLPPGWPDAICLAIARALLMGMAKPSSPPDPAWLGVFAAVIMPITWPALFASAPPESPCWIRALVCSMWLRSSVLPEPPSLAWIERLSALMMPAAGVAPPRPSALPSASTGVPRVTWDELPKLSVGRPEAPCRRSSATSSAAS